MHQVLKWLRRRPKIEFTCQPEFLGSVAAPVPANKVMPDWYRDLPPVDKSVVTADEPGFTVKRCLPFLDALSQGWIVPTPIDIDVELSGNGGTARTNSRYPGIVISSHLGFQVKDAPFENKVILKFVLPWSIRTAPGYSCLFVQPLNRPSIFNVISGVVDTDEYYLPVNIPFYFTRPDGVFTLGKGTPLVQIIPFKREVFDMAVRSRTEAEERRVQLQDRCVLSERAWYRKNARAKR
jgi:hypothetical protein